MGGRGSSPNSVLYGGDSGEAELLASAHRCALTLAVENDCSSIAFPAIRTGVYSYPVDEAALIAIRTSAEFLVEYAKPNLVRFVLFDSEAWEAYSSALRSIT